MPNFKVNGLQFLHDGKVKCLTPEITIKDHEQISNMTIKIILDNNETIFATKRRIESNIYYELDNEEEQCIK